MLATRSRTASARAHESSGGRKTYSSGHAGCEHIDEIERRMFYNKDCRKGNGEQGEGEGIDDGTRRKGRRCLERL